jgi:hypothetical protein
VRSDVVPADSAPIERTRDRDDFPQHRRMTV